MIKFANSNRQFMVWSKQSPRAWYDKLNTVVACHDLWWSSYDHSIFMRYSSVSTIILAVYVDDIDHQGVIQLKAYLNSHFHMKDLGSWDIIQGSTLHGLCKVFFCLNENNLLIWFVWRICILGSKHIDTPIDPNIHFDQKPKRASCSSRHYLRLIGKLIRFTITQPHITFVMVC